MKLPILKLPALKNRFSSAVLAAVLLSCASSSYVSGAASTEVIVTFPAFPVTVNTIATDQVHSEYPLLLYNNITYFPMTWNYTSALGLSVTWNEQDGLVLEKKQGCAPLMQNLTNQVNNRAGSQTAILAPFPVKVNGKAIVNAEEPYPVLLYRNITYFPMTWKFTNEEFNWGTAWDDTGGYAIQSCEASSSLQEQKQIAALNSANGGQLAYEDGWVYMNPLRSSGGEHQLIKSRPDESERIILSADHASSINVVGEWLYYIASEPSKPNAIYKMRTDGTERTLVSEADVSRLWVQDGWMYYITARRDNAANEIVRMKTDGSEKRSWSIDADNLQFFPHGDRIYYRTIGDGQNKLYYLDIAAPEPERVKIGDDVTAFMIADEWIYYVQNGKQLFKMDLDGSTNIFLYESVRPPLSGMTYRDGWVYYVNGVSGISGSVSTERVRLDGTGREVLFEARATALYLAGSELYFPDWSMGDHIMMHYSLDEREKPKPDSE